MIKNIELLADRLKGVKLGEEEITSEKFIELLKSEEEHELKFDSGSFMTDTDIEQFKERIGKESAKTGAKTIMEMEVKRLRNELGLEFEGKTIDNLVSAVKDKTLSEAKIPANEKVKELETSLQKIQSQYQTELTEKETVINQLTGTIKNEKINNVLLSSIPKDLKGVNPKQALTLLKTDYEFDLEGDTVFVKKGGEIIKDKFEKPIPFTDVINDYVVQNNWLNGEGRGGESSKINGNSTFKTKQELFKYMETNKIDIDSHQGQELLEKFKQE